MLTHAQIEDYGADIARALRLKQPMLSKAEIKAIRAELARARHARYNRSAKGRQRALRYNATDRGRARARRYEDTAWRRTYKQIHSLTGCTPYSDGAQDLALMAADQEGMVSAAKRMHGRPAKTVNVICSCKHGGRGHLGQRHIPVADGRFFWIGSDLAASERLRHCLRVRGRQVQ